PDRDRLSDLRLTPIRRDALAEPNASALAASAVAQMAIDEGRFELRAPTPAAPLGELRIHRYLDANALEIYREREPSPVESILPEMPQPSYQLPSGLELRAVQIPAGTAKAPKSERDNGPSLAGELVLAHDGATVRRPGVLFISDAGAQDRHGITDA